jgi:TPP-dependent pyruvate/acetoin dehydrogenase alpha subunit
MSDPAKYRTRDEVQKMREEHDPIEQVKPAARQAWAASDDDLKAVDKEVRALWQRRRRLRPERSPSPIRPSSGPTSTPKA